MQLVYISPKYWLSLKDTFFDWERELITKVYQNKHLEIFEKSFYMHWNIICYIYNLNIEIAVTTECQNKHLISISLTFFYNLAFY